MSHAILARDNDVNSRRPASAAKNLRTLLAGLAAPAPDVDISDITLDSRKVRVGGAFIALPGLRGHGLNFAQQAVAAGASVVLWESASGVPAPELPAHVVALEIPRLTSLVGELADRFFSAPSAEIRIAGFTGTNGKTTSAYVLCTALQQLGRRAAYAGTLGIGPIDAIEPGEYTTPDCVTVHRELDEMRARGIHDLGIEVSSHALLQQRVAAVRFDTAVFTNLTRDHLDYHGTLAAYGAAKGRLFEWPQLRHAVINIDDAFGRTLIENHVNSAMTLYGRSAAAITARFEIKQLFTNQVHARAHGLTLAIDGSWGPAQLRSRFVGDFNADNLLAALGVLLGWDYSLSDAVRALESCVAPPGRMETFSAPGKPLAIVDYAHTPDALQKALQAARQHCGGRLICVFGCGGDRDAGKRPLMGAIAERSADVTIITDDNPRTEPGDAIVAAIIAGMQQPNALVERDRARAIEHAIGRGSAEDVVLIAGKGHEDYQIVGLERRYFSDRDVVQAALRRAP